MINKVFLIGRLGQEPEVKHLPTGLSVCNLNVATNESFMKDGQWESSTEWHKVVIFDNKNKRVDSLSQMPKGQLVYIEGKIKTDSWEDKETGQKRYQTKIVASKCTRLSKEDSDNTPPLNRGLHDTQNPKGSAKYSGDDIPF